MAENAKWGKWTSADAGTIKEIAKTAKTLAEQVKTTSVLAQTAMNVVKVISELQSVNPFLAALDKLADLALTQKGADTITKAQSVRNMNDILDIWNDVQKHIGQKFEKSHFLKPHFS